MYSVCVCVCVCPCVCVPVCVSLCVCVCVWGVHVRAGVTVFQLLFLLVYDLSRVDFSHPKMFLQSHWLYHDLLLFILELLIYHERIGYCLNYCT